MHLVVFIHGMWGSGADFDNFEAAVVAALPQVLTLKVNSNRNKTRDGIVAGANRAFQEINEFLESNKDSEPTRLSIVGHSLGGLFARYVVMLLNQSGVLAKIKPQVFATFTSPHLGIRRYSHPLVHVNHAFHFTLGKINQSIAELGLEDKEKMLLKLTEPNFLDPLRMFQRRVCYANVRCDSLVPYSTGAIRLMNPYFARKHGKGIRSRHAEYSALSDWSLQHVDLRKKMYSTEANVENVEQIAKDELLKRELDSVKKVQSEGFRRDKRKEELRMIYQRLDALEWERYDVMIPTVDSHERIVNKKDNPLGRTVVGHFIDTVLKSSE